MLAWCELAVELATKEDTKILAHAHLANAHRVNGNFLEARRHLRLAEELSSEPDVLLLEFRASLDESMGFFEEAARCLETASRLRAQSGDVDGQAKVLTLSGRVLAEANRHTEAVAMFRAALETVESDHDVFRSAVHGLARSLAGSGQPAKALGVLKEAEPVLENGECLFRLKVSWLLGRIAMQCDAADLAATKLEEALEGYSAAGLPYETCLVTLDLARNDSQRGRVESALRLLWPVPDQLTRLAVPLHAEAASAMKLLSAGQVESALAVLEKIMAALERA